MLGFAAEALRVFSEAPPLAPQRVAELERSRDHEILAFLAAYTETMPADAARWVHHGLTSYDVADTARPAPQPSYASGTTVRLEEFNGRQLTPGRGAGRVGR